jgi:nitrogen fixation protein FixH
MMHEDMQKTGRKQRAVTGRTVFICLVGFFAVITGINAIMIAAAVSTFGGVETESSYKAGLAFSRDMAAVRAQDALRWQVTTRVSPIHEGAARFDLTVSDAAGRPVTGLEARIRFAHPTDRRRDVVFTAIEDRPGHFRGASPLSPGQRDLVVELAQGSEPMFRSKSRLVLR